jgi:hypothetical protein
MVPSPAQSKSQNQMIIFTKLSKDLLMARTDFKLSHVKAIPLWTRSRNGKMALGRNGWNMQENNTVSMFQI